MGAYYGTVPALLPLLVSLEEGSMPNQYLSEVGECAVRMVLDRLDGYPSVWAACQDVAPKLDIGLESLRKWVVQAQTDSAALSAPTSNELDEIRRLKREVKDFKEANEVLRAGLVFFARELNPHHR